MVPHAWASTNHLLSIMHLLLMPTFHQPHFQTRNQGLLKVTYLLRKQGLGQRL